MLGALGHADDSVVVVDVVVDRLPFLLRPPLRRLEWSSWAEARAATNINSTSVLFI